MNWILNCGLHLADRLLRQECRGADSSLQRSRCAFAVRYREVLAACAELETASGIAPVRLARDYMNCMLSCEADADWWRENGVYLDQPWFIWDYACAHGIIQPPPPQERDNPWPVRILRPETPSHSEVVHLRLTRRISDPNQGRIRIIHPNSDEAFSALVRPLGYQPKEDGFVRMIDEYAATIGDRAVELAVTLLENGYSVCIEEIALEQRILRREFSPEQKYWVLAAPQSDRLKLVYPRDPKLHQYVCMAGGRWNGHYVEFPICNADRLEELMRLYGFRTSENARFRLDLWHKALSQATVYRRRGGKTRESVAPEDVFQTLLRQPSHVIEELLESNE